MKERILKSSVRLFFKYGIRSVTMDDIAKELGISKKTIYQHYNDKDQIVNDVIDFDISCCHSDSQVLKRASENPVDGMLRGIAMISEGFALMKHTFINDLKKYYPGAWEKLMKHKNDFFIYEIEQNLEEGKAQGLYRDEIDVAILARLRLQQIEFGLDEDVFPGDRFSIVNVQMEFLHHFLRGVLSEEGFKIYNQFTTKSTIESLIHEKNWTVPKSSAAVGNVCMAGYAGGSAGKRKVFFTTSY